MWVLFALAGALLAAIAVVLSKAGLQKMDSTLAFAIEAILILTISWVAVIIRKQTAGIADIDRKTWIFLACAGAATCLSSLCTFFALKAGPASIVTTLERLSLVFAVVMAAFFLKEKINWQIIVGIILIIGGAVLVGMSRKEG